MGVSRFLPAQERRIITGMTDGEGVGGGRIVYIMATEAGTETSKGPISQDDSHGAPTIAIPPGLMIRDELEAVGMSQRPPRGGDEASPSRHQRDSPGQKGHHAENRSAVGRSVEHSGSRVGGLGRPVPAGPRTRLSRRFHRRSRCYRQRRVGIAPHPSSY